MNEPKSPFVPGFGSDNAFSVEEKYKDDFYIGQFYDEPDYEDLQPRGFGSLVAQNEQRGFGSITA